MEDRQAKKHRDYLENRAHGSRAFPCAFYQTDSEKNGGLVFSVPHHWHDELEIICIERGSYRSMMNAEELVIDEECILFVMPGTIHSLYTEGDYRESAVVFHLSMLGTEYMDAIQTGILQPLQSGQLKCPWMVKAGEEIYPDLKREMFRIRDAFLKENQIVWDQYQVKTSGGQLRVKTALMNILAMLEEHDLIQETEDGKGERIPEMRAVLSYIREHYGEKIYLADLAETAGMNEQYFCRYFKKIIGQTPVEYMNQYRLRKVMKRLLTTEGSVTEIAFDCGFHNLGHFQVKFKEMTGMTPLQYRKRGEIKG